MDIKLIKTEQISDQMERWWVSLPVEHFREFGFMIETLDGAGLHKRSLEEDNLMEVDVVVGRKDEMLALLHDLAAWE